MQDDLLVLEPRSALRLRIAQALLALVVVVATALFFVGLRDWYYFTVKIKSRPLFPALHPLLMLGPLAVLAARSAGAETKRIIERAIVVGAGLGVCALLLVSQRDALAYQCRRGRRLDACCSARLLGATNRDAPMVASCRDLGRTTACTRWRSSQPQLCPELAATER
jgi:hypothetical protein